MPSDAAHRHDRLTIVSMAVIASAVATLLHEGVGHGLTAFVRGDVPTELTSNHLSSLHPDRMVDAAGTIVNLIAGVAALLAASRVSTGANARYFFWILGALNLLPAPATSCFRIFGFGDGTKSSAACRIARRCGGDDLGGTHCMWLSSDGSQSR